VLRTYGRRPDTARRVGPQPTWEGKAGAGRVPGGRGETVMGVIWTIVVIVVVVAAVLWFLRRA
jgi:hypothetical protein